jgi:hypothetical protein
MKIPMAQNIPGADSGRIEQIIRELERLQKDANGIVSTYVDYVAGRTGNSFTATKAAIIFRLVRKSISQLHYGSFAKNL